MLDSDKARNWKQVSLWDVVFPGHKGDTYSVLGLGVWIYIVQTNTSAGCVVL